MPIYEYKCRGCGKKFEELVFSANATSPACPSCKSKKVEKMLSVFATTNSDNGGDFECGSPDMCPNAGSCGGTCGIDG